jgi:hypothetical protein
MPTRFAMRELKLTYLDKVQAETNNFLNDRVKHDFMRPDRELTLDLTLKEAEILIAANKEVRDLAESGSLKDLHNRYNDIHGKIESNYLAIREHLAKTLQVIEAKENALYEQINEEFGLGLKLHGEDSTFLDLLGIASGDPSFDNITKVEGQIEKGHERASQLGEIRGWLHSYMGIKARIFAIEADLKDKYCNHVAKSEDDAALSADEFRLLVAARNNYENSFGRFSVDDWAKAEHDTFIGNLNEVFETKGKQLISMFEEYEGLYNERQRLYQGFARDHSSESLTTFRTELLQHLAGSIVVKEHRQRYQQEQFDRFIASLQYGQLFKKQMTLRDFSREYANMIEILVQDSHNDRSPKIEANYDDFAERTIRPFNATIFYYFFSADRRKRTIAQWLLSAVRYPNDRVRRAYMRFFA